MVSEKMRLHLVKLALINKNDPKRKERARLLGLANKGRKHSEENSKKKSERQKHLYEEGKLKSWNKGLTKETNESLARQAKKVEGNIPWNKGKKNPYSLQTLDNMRRNHQANFKTEDAIKLYLEKKFTCYEIAKIFGCSYSAVWRRLNPLGVIEKRGEGGGRGKAGRSGRKKGFVVSEKTRKKLSDIKKGKYVGKNNPFYGHKHNPETIEKMKKKLSEMFSNGKAPMCGKSLIDVWVEKYGYEEAIRRNNERIKKLSKTLIGENNPNWRMGSSFEPYDKRFNVELREEIKKRDGYTCQLCGSVVKTCVHHIDYNKKNNEKENLITLCSLCNLKVNGKREYWKKFFQEKIIMEGGMLALL